MKKVVLISALILVVAIAAVSFSACNNATTEGQLENVWRPYEKYVYSVTDADGATGTYTVTIKHFKNADIADFGAVTLSSVKDGYLVTGELSVGTTSYLTKCYFNLIEGGSRYLVPVASYRKQVVDSVTTLEVQGSYDGAKLNYTGTKNGESIDGSVSVKSPYYDNNEFHQTLRGAGTLGNSFSFTFNVPVVAEEIGAIALTAAVKGTSDVTVPFSESAISCYEVKLSRSTKVAGASQSVYYAVDGIAADNGWKVVHPIVKIVEPAKDGNVVYELTSISLTEA